ncbi:MAG: ATP-dependent DNA helicase RecG [Parcubacteria group bacterium GW2011_GWA1_40_21]|nr:MAG: ATP-dependent DNA helicase RecG [Parcubacteria group bacterium GW2011_GWC1_40_13]KKR54155.1 MAG: ATP-dependent DNA helicase RecG [Parcubacteria group bacterium GW2011_GWA1_40_21]
MKLNSLIEENFRLVEIQKTALRKLGIRTIEDLLYHFPVRYGDTSSMKNIGSLVGGDNVVIFGKISGLKTSKAYIKKIPMAEAFIEDESGKIKAIWFHQPYLAKMIGENALVKAEGKVSERKGELYMSNPKIETVSRLPIGVGDSLFGEKKEDYTLYPVYEESRGITSNWIFHKIQKAFSLGVLDEITDPIPEEILKKYSLPSLKTSLVWIHSPHRIKDAESARKRLAFEEIFFIQLEKQKERIEYRKNPAPVIDKDEKDLEDFIGRFPFKATNAQRKAIADILADFKKGQAMSRLLEGDVGSGKTAVAAVAVYATSTTRPKGQDFGSLQTAYMAPTEILATQHFESFIKYFSYLNINIGLITGSGCRKFPSKVNPLGWTDISRTQLLKWVANGEIPILIGTHALIQKTVNFKSLALVIIDEQHRFGTAQRQKLAKKSLLAPHLLSMTATPIPRTLALTIYGDLDLTLLDEMPEGRKKIITEIVLPIDRDKTYEKIRAELKDGRQAYVICPRIDEPDPAKEMALLAKSVKEEAKRLKKDIFPEYEISILHSKMKPSEKEKVMNDFKDKKIDILVATSVVEVGVNVPNATIIVLEGAERFGLAQLHQLRGRVIRSNHQAYCYVFADTKTDKTLNRLKALKEAKNGFELAEFDLKFRGTGGLYGQKQWGISDIGMEAIKNIKMVEAARAEVKNMIEKDPLLNRYPILQQKLSHRQSATIHFE